MAPVRDMTDEELVDKVDMSGQTQFQGPFILEMQRRVMVETRRLTTEFAAFNKSSTTLTYIVIGVAIAQVIVAGFQFWLGCVLSAVAGCYLCVTYDSGAMER